VSFASPLDQDIKERIRQATDIVDLVGSYLPLRRQGRIYVGLCPWHDDSRPSLQVNPERQSWKCWVCDVGGDVFSFLMQYERIGFREALEILADRAGVQLQPAGRPELPPGSPHDKKTLYRAMQWAAQQFHQCLLLSPDAETARRYVAERGLTSESVKRFGLGFSPEGWQWLLDHGRTQGFAAPVLEATGLCARSPASGRYYDRFRGRLMFPIRDAQGRAIAFGGRILPGASGDNPAKYINSPETRLFSKSEHLYALDLARQSVTNKKLREIVVVEGYTDVMMAHQVGIDHVVAVLGTALGPRHIQVLRRFADRVILVLDGDEAGQRRTNEILELFVAAQIDLRILTLPEEFDPCEFLLERGAEPFRELLGTAIDALEHKIRVATRDIDLLRETHQANQALEEILATIAKASAQMTGAAGDVRLREQQFLMRLARQFGLPEQELRSRVNDLRRKPNRTAAVAKPQRPAAGPTQSLSVPKVRDLDSREIELLEILVVHPDLVELAIREIEVGQLKSECVRTIYRTIHGIHDSGGTPDFGNVLTALDDPGLKNIWVELDERAHAKAATAQTQAHDILQGLISDFRYTTMTRDRRQQLAALEEKRLDDQEELAVLQTLIAQERGRHGISAPKDG